MFSPTDSPLIVVLLLEFGDTFGYYCDDVVQPAAGFVNSLRPYDCANREGRDEVRREGRSGRGSYLHVARGARERHAAALHETSQPSDDGILEKFENFEAAVALHFAGYNFVKRHSSLRMTPAMTLGIEKDFWTYEELVERAS